MEASEQLDQLATALNKAQAVIPGAKKDSQNPHFRSTFADLASVWGACREALTNEGLSVAQMFEPAPDGHLMLRTTLLHSSGQWLSGVCLMPLPKADPQGYGSAATYARRYGLAAMVGVVPEDDDGNAASSPYAPQERASAPPPAQRPQNGEPAPAGFSCSLCKKSITRGQHDVSIRGFGQPLCPACQKAAVESSPQSGEQKLPEGACPECHAPAGKAHAMKCSHHPPRETPGAFRE